MHYSFPQTPFFSDWWVNYIDRPWLASGYGFAGFDCGGLVMYSTKFDRGVPLKDPIDGIKYTPDMARQKRTTAMKARIGLYKNDWSEIPRDFVIDGAAVLMRRSGEPKHLGIYMEDGFILHADESAGKVLMDPIENHEESIISFHLPKIVINANTENGDTFGNQKIQI